MATPVHIRVGDRGPVLARSVTRSDGTVEPLPTGSAVVLRLIDPDGTVIEHAAEIVDGDAGTVRYLWAEGEPTAVELDVAEQWRYVFVITLPDGRVVTSPTIGEDVLVVHPRAGAA